MRDALTAAREQDLDLVEVAPNAVPPVCRILDYGKFKYEQAKRDRAGKHQHHSELREVRFKVKISTHDLDMKLRRAERFLKEGDKVKLSVMFRGREITRPELGRTVLERAKTQLAEVAIIEKPPTMEGRFMNMIMGPARAKQPAPKPAAAKATPEPAPALQDAKATPEPEPAPEPEATLEPAPEPAASEA